MYIYHNICVLDVMHVRICCHGLTICVTLNLWEYPELICTIAYNSLIQPNVSNEQEQYGHISRQIYNIHTALE